MLACDECLHVRRRPCVIEERCSELQYVAVYHNHNVLQSVAECCSVLQCGAV